VPPRRVDLKTGTDCNCNCVFCVIGDQLFQGERPLGDCVQELELSRETCDDVVFTGAEVTIRPDFLDLVRAAKKLGYRRIQIQTNGRMLAYPEFARKAVAAGANEFSPSIHGHEAKLHDGLVRAPGSFEQIVQSIRNLKALGQRVITNTVVTRQNARHLPAIARMLVDLKVDQFQIAFPHPTGHAATYFDVVVPRVSDVDAFIHEALAVGVRAGVPCMAEAMPYCRMTGFERHVAELFIPPTEIVYDGFVVPDYARDRMDRGKTRFEGCAPCRWEPVCEGPWRGYPERMGSEEFVPVAGPRVVDARLLLDDRFGLLGTPASRFAELEAATAPWVAVVFYAEEGSPACAIELAGLSAAEADLAARGIAVVPVCGMDRRDLAEAYSAWREGPLRSTYVLDSERRIAHVVTDVDVHGHAGQIGDVVGRLTAPPRPLAKRPDLVLIRSKDGRREPMLPAEVAHLAELEP